METTIKGFQNPKPGSKVAPPPPQRGLQPPLSLSAKLCDPVLAVKGPLRRFAPLTAAGRPWGLAVYEGKGGTATGGDLRPDAVAQTSGFATPPDPDGLSRV